MVDHPKVTVLIPCFNLGEFLPEAVDSVVQQSFTDFEIIVVDDGSDDGHTAEVVGGLKTPKTQVIRTPNRGLAAARNLAISKASGDYLCALDADDTLHVDFLAKMVAALEADPQLTFASCWLRAFGDEDWLWKQERCDLPALLAENTVCTAALVRREAVLAVAGYDEGMPHQGDEDWDLWLRLVAAGHRGAIIPEVLFFYRRRAGSMSLDSDHGDTHLALVRYLVTKHEPLYRRHLHEVLRWKEGHIGDLLRTNDSIERDVFRLESEIARRRTEIEDLRRRQSGAPVESAESRELSAARAEVRALRSSWSWRVTAPLRALYDLVAGPKSGD